MNYIYSGGCVAKDCFWAGILFTCDLNFEKLIDALPLSFELLIKRRQDASLLCVTKEYAKIKNIIIDPFGKITEYKE
jgi:hypothetical protein